MKNPVPMLGCVTLGVVDDHCHDCGLDFFTSRAESEAAAADGPAASRTAA
jgi:hypothetical protein